VKAFKILKIAKSGKKQKRRFAKRKGKNPCHLQKHFNEKMEKI